MNSNDELSNKDDEHTTEEENESSKQQRKLEFSLNIDDFLEVFPMNRLTDDECAALSMAYHVCNNFLGFATTSKSVGDVLVKADHYIQWACALHAAWSHRIECLKHTDNAEFSIVINNALHRLLLYICSIVHFLRDLPTKAQVPKNLIHPVR